MFNVARGIISNLKEIAVCKMFAHLPLLSLSPFLDLCAYVWSFPVLGEPCWLTRLRCTKSSTCFAPPQYSLLVQYHIGGCGSWRFFCCNMFYKLAYQSHSNIQWNFLTFLAFLNDSGMNMKRTNLVDLRAKHMM
jgi:hypothetical protein